MKENISKTIFCRVAWMGKYQGQEKGITHGGEYIEIYGRGYEECNFVRVKGKVYGYVRGPGKSKKYKGRASINISKIDASKGKNDSETNGATVIFIAKNPNEKQTFIVGWYKSATVFRELQDRPDGRVFKSGEPNELYLYNLSTNSSDAKLIEPNKRDYKIRTFEKNYPGQSNVFYYRPEAKHWIEKVLDYINEDS